MTDDLMARLRHGSVWVEIEDDQTMNEAADALDAKDRRIAELEAALKPFAEQIAEARWEEYNDSTWVRMPLGDLRAARAAYLGTKNG